MIKNNPRNERTRFRKIYKRHLKDISEYDKKMMKEKHYIQRIK